MFDPGTHFWSPRPTSWPRKARGPFWGAKRGPEKHNFVEGSVPHEVSLDFSRGERFVRYQGSFWVDQFPPKPCQGEVLQGFSPNPKNPGGPPGPLWGLPIAPCGPFGSNGTNWHGIGMVRRECLRFHRRRVDSTWPNIWNAPGRPGRST